MKLGERSTLGWGFHRPQFTQQIKQIGQPRSRLALYGMQGQGQDRPCRVRSETTWENGS
jgi:hypothetical protein